MQVLSASELIHHTLLLEVVYSLHNTNSILSSHSSMFHIVKWNYEH